MTRFIRGCLIAAGYVLVFLGSARAVTIGDTAVLSAPDNGNGDLLLVQSATLAQTATIQSLSFYVTGASGNLILGIYDATGPNGGPGTLKASTASFAPTTGWNTANVTQPVSLTAGTYWLAYLPSTDNLSFVKTNGSGNCAYFAYGFGGMPSTFSASPASCTPTTWSFYATLAATTSSGGTSGSTGPSGGAGNVAFTALHTYYISPTGSDSNSGTSPATAWATPNHAVNCGDVIIAAAGSYPDLQAFGSVSGCPSTSGGIDGTGGVYFATLLCGGASVGDCYITAKTNTSGNTTAIELGSSNWAMEGWYINTSGHGRAFESYACTYGIGLVHHIAFINDISANNLDGYDTNECWQDIGSTALPSPVGTDYFATVGSIAQNSAQDSICLAAIDVVAPGNLDANPGTHFFIYGNFSYANVNTAGCRTQYDTEDYMFDTWDGHYTNSQGVLANNIGFDADRYCVQVYEQTNSTPTPTMKIYNNTCFQNVNFTGGDYNDGEINIISSNPSGTISYIIRSYDNIAYQTLATSNGGGHIAAYLVANPVSNYVDGGTGLQNVFRANNVPGSTACLFSFCNSANDAQANGSSAMLGTDIYADPSFTNTTDLLANRLGVPNCSGFANTTECMGYNPSTKVLTTPSIISDLRSATYSDVGAAGLGVGKGYQLPSTTCAEETNFTGSISTTTLTVSGVGGIPLGIGQQVIGAGVTPNTIITAGSGTSWTINHSQNVGSEAMGATNYPYWLKGVVYLHWNGSSLTENADLVNKPCGL